MPDFIIHSIPGSPFGRAVLAALHEKGVPYRFSMVTPGALRSPEHLARHPFGRVPVLEHDGFAFTRPRPSCATSIACCRSRRSRRPIQSAPRAWTR